MRGIGNVLGHAFERLLVKSGLGIPERRMFGNLVVAHVFFQGAEIAVVTAYAFEINAHLADLTGGKMTASVELVVQDQPTAHSGPERESDHVAQALRCAMS